MNLRLSDEDTEALRAQAELEHRSMNEVAILAIRERVSRSSHSSRVLASIERVERRDGALLDLLSQ